MTATVIDGREYFAAKARHARRAKRRRIDGLSEALAVALLTVALSGLAWLLRWL